MSIPDFQTLMLPALRVLAQSKDATPTEVVEQVADNCQLTSAEREEMLPSGASRVITKRVHWAVTYLQHAGLVEKPRRGVWQITDEGQRLLATSPPRIDNATLKGYPAFVAWVRATPSADAGTVDNAAISTASTADTGTPEEVLERTWQGIKAQVATDLLDAIRSASPTFFERLVVQLLVAMGYGGSYAEAARVTRASGDGGIDGIIKEDRLGLDAIYVQAKRWEAVVGRPEIQKFAGSLEGERARKGVFITTSSFSPDARSYVQKIDKRIVLIDGIMLADLMIEHGVGVTADREYVIPKIDLDFFEDA